jgi:TetR/AcrR family transcriptional regulator
MKEAFRKLPDEKRLFILNTSAEIFARDGYHEAAIADICKNSGISNGALYKYFNNKDDLFLSIIDHGIDLVRGLFHQFETTTPVLDTLNKIFTVIKNMAREQGFIISIYLDLGTCALNRFAEQKSDILEKIGKDFLTELLSNAASRGEIHHSLNIRSAVYLIDNLIILYSYSTVSAHYHKRLLVFMNEKSDVSEKKKIAFMLGTIRDILGMNKNTLR